MNYHDLVKIPTKYKDHTDPKIKHEWMAPEYNKDGELNSKTLAYQFLMESLENIAAKNKITLNLEACKENTDDKKMAECQKSVLDSFKNSKEF